MQVASALASVPASVLRKSSRCPHCRLNQFELASGKCRRCHEDLYPPPETIPEPMQPPAPLIPLGAFESASSLTARLHAQPQSHAHSHLHSHPLSFWLPVVLLFLRLRSGLSQSQLARRMHTGRIHISKVECGVCCPVVETLERYANGIGVGTGEVLRLCELLMQGNE